MSFVSLPGTDLDESRRAQSPTDSGPAPRRPRSSAHGRSSAPEGEFVTVDPTTRAALERAELFARSDLAILVEGPSGVGKELVARRVHLASRLSPFVAVNCGALPEALEEAEMFGVRRGAYTGATTDREGLVQAADGGTLFLDEVGEMPLSLQAKLLRFLELGEVRRVGETSTHTVRVRVVSATNRDLRSEVRAGRFRLDLFHRLAAVPIAIPSLAARPVDVRALAELFLRDAWPEVVPHPSFVEALVARSWPGNARELKLAVRRAVVVARAERRVPNGRDVEPSEPGDLHADDGSADYVERVRRFERRLIEEALREAGGNKARAAVRLGGLSRTTLIGKMRRLGIQSVGSSNQNASV